METTRQYPLNSTIVVVEIHRFTEISGPARSDVLDTMYSWLQETLGGDVWETGARHGVNSGVQLFWRPEEPPRPVILKLLARLAEHPRPNVRLQIALNQGGVRGDDRAYIGHHLDEAILMAKEKVLIEALDQSGCSVALLVADQVHDEIVRTGEVSGLGPFHPVELESRPGHKAWLLAPGAAIPTPTPAPRRRWPRIRRFTDHQVIGGLIVAAIVGIASIFVYPHFQDSGSDTDGPLPTSSTSNDQGVPPPGGFAAHVAWTDDGGPTTILATYDGPTSHAIVGSYNMNDPITLACQDPSGRSVPVGPQYHGPSPKSKVWYRLTTNVWVPAVYTKVDNAKDKDRIPSC